MPFAATGRSKPHPTTAATPHSARTNHVSVATRACLLVYTDSPSTSSSQARPAPSLRTATAPLWRASITCLKSWPFHSVEQPCLQPDQAQAVIRAYATVRRLDLTLASHNKVDDKQYIRVVGSNAQLTCLFLTTAVQRVQLALDMFR